MLRYYDGRIFPSFVQYSWEVTSPIFIGLLLLRGTCDAGARLRFSPSLNRSLSLLRHDHPAALKNYALYEEVAASTEGTFGSGAIISYCVQSSSIR